MLTNKSKKKKKNSKTSIPAGQVTEIRTPIDSSNLLLSMQYNPASLNYGLVLSAIFCPGAIGSTISFVGGFMLAWQAMVLVGVLLILIAPVVWITLKCLRNRYMLLSNVQPSSKPNSSSISIKDSKDSEKNSIANESFESFARLTPFPTTIQSKNVSNPSITKRIWLSAADFIQLHQQLPWSCGKVDVESAEWFNQIISSVWKQMQTDFNNQLDQMFGPERFLDSWFGDGNRFAKLRLIRASLGNCREIKL